MISNFAKQAHKAFVYFCLINSLADLDNKVLVVKADQPVHCLRGQVFGVWNFHVSQSSDSVNLF